MNNYLSLSSSTKSYNSWEQTNPINSPAASLSSSISKYDPATCCHYSGLHAYPPIILPIHVHMNSSMLPLIDVSVLILLNINNLFSARTSKMMGYDMKQMEAFLQEAVYKGVADPAVQQQTQAAVPQTTLLMCYPFSLNLEKHEWSWDNAAHREMPEACRRLSYVFSLHWVLNRRVHSLSLYLTVWNTWMNYSCFKHYSSNALQRTCFFHNASPSTRSFIQRFFKPS